MILDIDYDPDAREIFINVDNALKVTAFKHSSGEVEYTPNFEKIDDEDLYEALQCFCSNLLKEGEEE